MSAAAKSVFIFGIYLGILSLALLVQPNFLLQTFGMPPTEEVWIRIVGMLVLTLGIFYMQMARVESATFFWLTVYARCYVILFFTAFVVLDWVSPMLILFGAVDLAGAIWTWIALKKN